MKRADGDRLVHCDPFYEIIPHIMPYSYDATNYIDLDLDLERIQKYIRDCRQRGVSMTHMSILIAAYTRLVSQNPNLNRFVCNKRIYARNHFCVAFTTLKTTGASGEETVTKVTLDLDDTIFEIHEKLTRAIEANRTDDNNAVDRLLRKVMRVPFLVGSVVSFLKWWDRHFGLPRAIIDGSPFHVSLFLTNLASIRLRPVYHHIYDFGTTGLFLAIGQPERSLRKVGEVVEARKVLPIKLSCDDRVESGYYYAKCFREYQKYLQHPEWLEEKPDRIVRDPNLP